MAVGACCEPRARIISQQDCLHQAVRQALAGCEGCVDANTLQINTRSE